LCSASRPAATTRVVLGRASATVRPMNTRSSFTQPPKSRRPPTRSTGAAEQWGFRVSANPRLPPSGAKALRYGATRRTVDTLHNIIAHPGSSAFAHKSNISEAAICRAEFAHAVCRGFSIRPSECDRGCGSGSVIRLNPSLYSYVLQTNRLLDFGSLQRLD